MTLLLFAENIWILSLIRGVVNDCIGPIVSIVCSKCNSVVYSILVVSGILWFLVSRWWLSKKELLYRKRQRYLTENP